MKTRFIAPIGLLLLLWTLTGCSTFQENAGKTLATTVQTVDAAMKGWAAYVAIGGATAQQEASVKAAYQKYQAAEAIAEKAFVLSVTTGDQNGFTTAAAVLRQVQADLLLLINTFSPKGK